jgi:uncharacterized membrane protein
MENNNNNVKLYSILSYVGILWIIGLLVKEKDDKSLRFHVGQGMLLFIVFSASSVVLRIFSNILVFVMSSLFSDFGAVVSVFFLILVYGFVYIFQLILMIIGIVNASNGKEDALPIIGKYAFYK